MNEVSASNACGLCGGALHIVAPFTALRRVTSDCRPWPSGGTLAVCCVCALVQKPTNADWTIETQTVYRGYDVYHQSGGAEQVVYDASGIGASRSNRILTHLAAFLPPSGPQWACDIGCGKGTFLQATKARWPSSRLSGFDLDDRERARVENIAGTGSLYTGDLADLPPGIELFTMIHCLEHIPKPVSMLAALAKRAAERGRIFIEVPDYQLNPFDLLIADHCSHFSVATLSQVIRATGLESILVSNQWIPKEISAIVSTRTSQQDVGQPIESAHRIVASVTASIRWLAEFAASAKNYDAETIGVFGTSIGGTWLAGELGERCRFFVDEDPSRVGRQHLGRNIVHPSQVPAGASLFLPFEPARLDAIVERLQGGPGVYVRPPVFEYLM